MYPNKIGVKNSSKCIDLRSDTVTRASPEMRKVMAEAEVGDDVYEEDPTVNSLEERCAKLFGKEAAIFVTTGTMGNLLAIMAHTMGKGEIIVGRTSHIHRWEVGGYARIAGVSATTLPINHDGTMSLESIEECLCFGDNHRPQTKLICLENTHNFVGGKALPLDYLTKVKKLADPFKAKIHIDGARIYNAAVKHNVSLAELVKDADSIQIQQLMLHLNSLNRSGNNGGVGVGVASLQLEENCYICPQCFRSYRRHGTLRRHLRQECGKGKSMVCSVCGHRTKRADHLRQHVRKRHPELGMRILFNNGNNAPTTAATTATDVNSVSTTAAPAVTQSSQLQISEHYQQFEEQLRHFKNQHDIL